MALKFMFKGSSITTEHVKKLKRMGTNITYIGKDFKSTYGVVISKDYIDTIYKEFYRKPKKRSAIRQMQYLYLGNVNIHDINNYYISEIMYDCKLSKSKWTINEFMKSDDLIYWAVDKIRSFPAVYPSTKSIAENLNVLFRIGSSMTANKISNFPYFCVIDILKKYNVNNNWYDFSCGWGVRLLAALANNVNYFGTDPNDKLVPKLKDMSNDFLINTKSESNVDIRLQGSEFLVKDWENKIGLAFSSPPYFNLENYQHGKQSILNRDYTSWLKMYWAPTVLNISKYLIKEGYFILNVKNVGNYDLCKDMIDIIKSVGFKKVDTLSLKNITRSILKENNKNSNESIYVFKKIIAL